MFTSLRALLIQKSVKLCLGTASFRKRLRALLIQKSVKQEMQVMRIEEV